MQLTDLIVDFDAIEFPINLMDLCGFGRCFISMNRRHDNTMQTTNIPKLAHDNGQIRLLANFELRKN